MTEEEELRQKLSELVEEHRDLDSAINALEEAIVPDQLQIRRMKKRKLGLKDQISSIEDMLIPDIIA